MLSGGLMLLSLSFHPVVTTSYLYKMFGWDSTLIHTTYIYIYIYKF